MEKIYSRYKYYSIWQYFLIFSATPGSTDYRRPANPQNPSQSGPQAYNVLEMVQKKVYFNI